MDEEALLAKLCDVAGEVQGGVRMKEMPSDETVALLCDLLRQCARHWHSSKEIPKLLAMQLIGTSVSILENMDRFSALDRERLLEIYIEFDMLLWNIIS